MSFVLLSSEAVLLESSSLEPRRVKMRRTVIVRPPRAAVAGLQARRRGRARRGIREERDEHRRGLGARGFKLTLRPQQLLTSPWLPNPRSELLTTSERLERSGEGVGEERRGEGKLRVGER